MAHEGREVYNDHVNFGSSSNIPIFSPPSAKINHGLDIHTLFEISYGVVVKETIIDYI